MIFSGFFDWVQSVALLAHTTQKNTTEIKELNQEVRRLSDEMIRLAAEIERLKEVSRYERENFMLQINDTLLQFERRLPPDSR